MRLDTTYTAETPEGIALSLRPAGIVARSLAYLIDLGIRLCLFVAIAVVSNLMGGLGKALMLLSYFALEWLYPVVFELSRAAATPGKRAMGLRVVMDSGLPVTPAASLIRNLLRAADFLPAFYGTGLAALLLRSDGKRLGDMAAGTLVVFAGTVRLHGDVPKVEPLAPTRALSLAEQAAIVSWAGRATRLTPERFEELAALATPVLPMPPGGAVGEPVAPRLLGVAQWALGRRGGGPA